MAEQATLVCDCYTNYRITTNAPLDKLLGDPEQNLTYLDYRADILVIKNYERMQGTGLLGGFSARYTVDGNVIRTV